MRSALLTKRSPSGLPHDSDEVVLVCKLEDIRILFDALDLYCAKHAKTKTGKKGAELYHELGWNTHYFPKDKK